jgi:hypothetical protein
MAKVNNDMHCPCRMQAMQRNSNGAKRKSSQELADGAVKRHQTLPVVTNIEVTPPVGVTRHPSARIAARTNTARATSGHN